MMSFSMNSICADVNCSKKIAAVAADDDDCWASPAALVSAAAAATAAVASSLWLLLRGWLFNLSAWMEKRFFISKDSSLERFSIYYIKNMVFTRHD